MACSPTCASHSSSSSISSLPSPPPTTYSLPGWCTSPAPLPVNLHVCHEPRVEALRRYALMFGIARQPGHVYFDPARDILYFGPCDGYMAAEAQLRTLLVLADPDELALVQRVALSEGVLDPSLSTSTLASASASTNLAVDVLHQLRTRLPNLREFIVVPHDENFEYSNDAVLVPLPLPSMALPLGRLSAMPGSSPSLPCISSLPRQIELVPAAASSNVDTMTPTLDTTNRLARQIHTAMRRVCAAAPGWTPPRWRILMISSSEKARPQRGEEGIANGGVSASPSRSKRQGKLKAGPSGNCCPNSTVTTPPCDFCGEEVLLASHQRSGSASRRSAYRDCGPVGPSSLPCGSHRSRR